MAPATVAERLVRLDELLVAEERSRSEVAICVGPNKHPITPTTVQEYAGVGVQQLNVPVGGRDLDGFKRRAEKMAKVCGLVD